MTSEELKAAIRAFIYDKDAYTSNGAANVVHAMDLLIDAIDAGGGGGGAGGLNDVLAVGQAITGTKNTLLSPNAKWIIADDLSDWLRLDNTENVQSVKLICPNNDNTGYSEATFNANDDDGYVFRIQASNGLENTAIVGYGQADNKSLELTVYDGVSETGQIVITPISITNNKDTIISNLAGGGITGLSMDNDGKIIRTP